MLAGRALTLAQRHQPPTDGHQRHQWRPAATVAMAMTDAIAGGPTSEAPTDLRRTRPTTKRGARHWSR